MRRNKLFILGLFFAFVAVLSLTLVSGTWAKYTSNVTSAEATAKVAKWEWEAKGTNDSGSFQFNLFKTILDTKDNTEVNPENPYAEADVKPGSETVAIIAPGTRGEATITIKNKSEVTGKVTVKFTLTNNENIPLTFKTKVNGVESAVSWSGNTYTIELPDFAVGSAAQTVVLSWEWPFSADASQDSTDKTLGEAGTATLSIKADLSFVQVD